LLQTIIDITSPSAGTDDRRQAELLRSITTLDKLSEQLQKRGLSISRSATYLRLIPRRSDTNEGKRHVSTAPAKLIRAPNAGRNPHPYSHFAAATIQYLEDLAMLFGTKSVFVISQDDKARVPLGLPAAKKPSTIINAFRVSNGSTYIAVRSGKHDDSTVFTYLTNLFKYLSINKLKEYSHTDNSEIKPIFIVFTDGGPDQKPRFPKIRQYYSDLFIRNDLDALFVATNAPGHSVHNPIERRMASLSHDLSGLILPYDHYGTHLNDSGKTIDIDLEKKTFQLAGGEVLAEVWSNTIIDTHAVIPEYISPSSTLNKPTDRDEQWKSTHVRQSQYCLQIVKCNDIKCCGEHMAGNPSCPVKLEKRQEKNQRTKISNETSAATTQQQHKHAWNGKTKEHLFGAETTTNNATPSIINNNNYQTDIVNMFEKINNTMLIIKQQQDDLKNKFDVIDMKFKSYNNDIIQMKYCIYEILCPLVEKIANPIESKTRGPYKETIQPLYIKLVDFISKNTTTNISMDDASDDNISAEERKTSNRNLYQTITHES
ncbi:unnamed protein product, partial [Adineta steineri]